MRLTGLGVSPGIGIGKALVLRRGARDFRFRIPAARVEREIELLGATATHPRADR
jgi:phosphoenolpyruvate-protein kinase (PTS system EI component)